MSKYTVYLIRHAKSEANITHVYGTDAPLSKEGIIQAKSAHVDITPDICISGEKKRQIQTAAILFPEKYKGEITAIFNEINFGDLENTEIGNKSNSDLIKDVSLNHITHGGDDVWVRAESAIKFILQIPKRYPDKSVAIVTSDTLIQSIVTRLVYGKVNGIIWSGQYYVPNCTYVTFNCEDGHIKEIEMPDHTILPITAFFPNA